MFSFLNDLENIDFPEGKILNLIAGARTRTATLRACDVFGILPSEARDDDGDEHFTRLLINVRDSRDFIVF